jgi:hypothetical protein
MSCSIVDLALALLIQRVPLYKLNGAGKDSGGLGAASGGSRRSDELAKQERSQDVQGQKSAWRRTGAEMGPQWLGSLTISLTEANTSEKGSSGSKVKCTSLPEGKVRRFKESQVLTCSWKAQ